MKRFLLFVSLLCCLLQSSCHKEKVLQDVDYLIFSYGNLSWGSYCEAYKLTPDVIFSDSMPCSTDGFVFHTVPMGNTSFSLAQHLIDEVPESLFNGSQTAFEGEECNDCGGYAVEISRDGAVKKFFFGEMPTKDWPKEVRNFYADVVEVLGKLPQ